MAIPDLGQHGDTAHFQGVLHMELPFGLIVGMKNLRNYQKTFLREIRYGTFIESRSLRS